MPKHINLTGKTGETYDLEALKHSGTRTAADEDLIVQIWYWNPDGLEMYNGAGKELHKKPNPSNLKIGQIWLSKLVPVDFKEE